MKKLYKYVFSAFITVLSVCFICSGCLRDSDSGNKNDGAGSETHSETSEISETIETHIEVNGYKTEFNFGEEFSTGNIIVILIQNGNQKILQPGEYEIDSGAYNKSVSGDYTIIVYCREYEIKTEYTVKVYRDEENDGVWGDDLWL